MKRQLSQLNLLLSSATLLTQQPAKKTFADMGEAGAQLLLDKVNRTREKLGASPLSLSSPRKVGSDLKKILESQAMQLCRENQSFTLWKRWVFSHDFLRYAPHNPAYDECADLLLGLDERKLQRELKQQKIPYLYRKEHTYLDLTPEELFTPYPVLLHILERIPKGRFLFADLGSGLGRAGFTLLAKRPQGSFIGYEMVAARARLANEMAAKAQLSHRFQIDVRNLASDPRRLPSADYFFLFNPFTSKTLRKVLRELKSAAKPGAKIIAVLHGEPFHQLKRAPWVRRAAAPTLFPFWRGKGFQVFEVK